MKILYLKKKKIRYTCSLSKNLDTGSSHITMMIHVKCNCIQQMFFYIWLHYSLTIGGVRVMVFNATFNNISVILWWSVLLWVEVIRVPEKTTDLSQVTDKLYHIMLYQVHLAWMGFELTTLVVIGTDCIGSYKSSYHMITTAPINHWMKRASIQYTLQPKLS